MNVAHKEPFSRFLVSQAQSEAMLLVSTEKLCDCFAVQRLRQLGAQSNVLTQNPSAEDQVLAGV